MYGGGFAAQADAIRLGFQIAVDEANAAGGAKGQQLRAHHRRHGHQRREGDHRGAPHDPRRQAELRHGRQPQRRGGRARRSGAEPGRVRDRRLRDHQAVHRGGGSPDVGPRQPEHGRDRPRHGRAPEADAERQADRDDLARTSSSASTSPRTSSLHSRWRGRTSWSCARNGRSSARPTSRRMSPPCRPARDRHGRARHCSAAIWSNFLKAAKGFDLFGGGTRFFTSGLDLVKMANVQGLDCPRERS